MKNICLAKEKLTLSEDFTEIQNAANNVKAIQNANFIRSLSLFGA